MNELYNLVIKLGMHIILTHEQADFDAIGSLLGAALLNEKAYPVLPHRMNRNVRAFLNIYGAELPFVEPRDLPSESIENLVLVDTQSMATLKGFSHKTQVHVVDHHTPRADFPVDWTLSASRTGSCTTLLVEDLQEHNGHFTMVQSTLMLLGIYEDTGSLTYASTTPRDIRCAAYLLEQGASLRIAVDYLNPPLSPDQRHLYDQLLHNSVSNQISGQNIIVASASAGELNEEISSIAHKLRDLLDPDALFLLVTTIEGIRMVARSTSDQVDVAKIAAQFGGGGHERAAAALIKLDDGISQAEKQKKLSEIQTRLTAMLPEFIQPSITVGQIMSRKPKLLNQDTPVQEAALLMQRFGYEGYPVVHGGKILGLLTRRAVDRALAHKLNLPASSLMEAGEVKVLPTDSLQHLQTLMAETGWGQIPVVDPITDKVVGIVTRTDLLKTLAGGESSLPGRKNLRTKLEAALPANHLALLQLIAAEAAENRLPIYIVGGFVRDLILDRSSLDFDIVVEGDAIQFARKLSSRYGGRVISHSRFGTAKWWVNEISTAQPFTPDQPLPESLDLISARSEFYEYPTALPTIERSGIKLDLHRRDFTFNTLALRLDGRHQGDLYDYWGGLNDLHKGLVRVLHSLSFIDDPTRMLRAVRFEQRFGFKIEQRTLQLMEDARPMLHQVSGDRLRHELNLILSEERAPAMLERLEELGLLSAIHPDLSWQPSMVEPLIKALTTPIADSWNLPDQTGQLAVRQQLAYMVWLMALPVERAAEISSQLFLSSKIRSALLAANKLRQELPLINQLKPSEITARLEQVPPSGLYALYLLGSHVEILQKYTQNWRLVKPQTNGHALRSRGIQPGPEYRRILAQLRNAWLDGHIASAAEEKALLEKLIADE